MRNKITAKTTVHIICDCGPLDQVMCHMSSSCDQRADGQVGTCTHVEDRHLCNIFQAVVTFLYTLLCTRAKKEYCFLYVIKQLQSCIGLGLNPLHAATYFTIENGNQGRRIVQEEAMDSQAMRECACSSTNAVLHCLWTCLQKHIGYVMDFKSNVANLGTLARKLEARRRDIETRVSADQAKGEMATAEVLEWLKNAKNLEEDAGAIEKEAGANKTCFNCRWRYKLSKRAKAKLDAIDKQYNNGSFEKVTITPPPSAVEIYQAPQIGGLKSANTTMKKILDALNDEKIRAIGVYGMGGVGKTTIVRNVNNHLKGSLYFSRVIMVTVSKELDLKRMQNDIAKRLGLDLRDEMISHRAAELKKRLMQEEKFLIIFDDLWNRLELADVGIPSFENHKGFKAIFTSRSEDVCREIEAPFRIKVQLLSEYESWELFKQKAGDIVEAPTLQGVAKKVANECRGLPLALVTAGRALNDQKSVRVWNNALSEMKKSAPTYITGMEQEVYRSLKLSFDHLQSEELKSCLLFCILFPEDYEIDVDHLIQYYMGEGLLKGAETLEEALNKGHSVVEKLKAACLLLDCDKEGYVMMHDIFRDVAISIASNVESYKFLVKAGLVLREWPKADSWGAMKRISVMRNEFEKLPYRLECPELLTLMMQENSNLRSIPDQFFEGAKSLRVLDLSRTSIQRLPSSLSYLLNLRELCLQRCPRLEVQGLSPLRLLTRSTISELPSGIGELINLRRLDISFNTSLKFVPQNVISKLTRLEEFKMVLSFTDWRTPRTRTSRKTNASLDEFASLRQLSCLCLDMVDTNLFRQDAIAERWENLERFCFRIDWLEHDADVFEYMKSHHRMMIIDGLKPIPQWAKTLFSRTTFLQLYYRKGLTAFSRLYADTTVEVSFKSLEYLEIYKCSEMEYIIGEKDAKNMLENLQHMELHFLQNLLQIARDVEDLPQKAFQNLRYVKVVECDKLKNALPSSLWQWMQNLSNLEVYNCSGMEYVLTITKSGLTQDTVLPKLETVHLEGLPKLRSIWMGIALPLQNVRRLSFVKCHGLNVVLSSTLATGLPNLEEFHVRDCHGVEGIISQEDGVADARLLPNLTFLELRGLPKLERICEEAQHWHFLEEIAAKECPILMKLPLDTQMTSSLRWIKGEKHWWEGLKWTNERAKDYFAPRFRDVEVPL